MESTMSSPKMQLEDWLDDLCVRFIINLPQEDLQSVPRICFQVEEAQWFYEDFIRPLDPSLPSMSLRSFCMRIFQHCPLLTTFPVGVHIQAFEEFLAYKVRIPVRGAILLNEEMDAVVLVKGWKKGANWSFPRGKINKDEDDLDCAIREVYEETGFDIRDAGLVPPKEAVKFIEVTMRDQQIRLYVFRNVPETTLFEPKTRKEISKIEWYKLSELPAFRKKAANGNGNSQSQNANNANNANKFYMVAPFLVPLKKWVVQQKKKDGKGRQQYLAPEPVMEETGTEDEIWIPRVESQSQTQTQTQTQPQPQSVKSGVPDQDVLASATRELQRLLKMQPPTQGLQPHLAQANSQADKGGALLALLQSKGNSSTTSTGLANHVPQTPQDHTIMEPQEPDTPRQHAAQHPPLANYKQAPPHFPISVNAPVGQQPQQQQQQQQWYAIQTQTQTSSLAASHPNLLNSLQATQQHAPPLVHPQPLPPQVQKTSVINYTTPPPNVINSQAQMSMPMLYPGQQPLPNQGRPYNAGPLNSHSRALLDVFKAGSPRNPVAQGVPAQPDKAVAMAMLQQQQQPTREQHVIPDAAAASQPYQQANKAAAPLSMYASPPQKLFNGSALRGQGPVDEKHRTALLDMFKTADSNSGSPSQGPAMPANQQHARAGPSTDPVSQLPMAALSMATVPASAGQSSSYQNTQRGENTTSSYGSNAAGVQHVQAQPSLLSLLSRKPETRAPAASIGNSPDGRSHRQQPHHHHASPLLSTSLAPYNENPQLVPSSLASPPVASRFPLPTAGATLHRRPEAPPEHKQKLLSLFGPAAANTTTTPPSASAASIPNVGDPSGKGKEIYRVGSGEPGAGLASPGGSSGAGAQTPISPANRNFLLGFLQSASKRG